MLNTSETIATYSAKEHPVIDVNYPKDQTPSWQDGTVILIDKPKGWSSFKVVYEVRKCIQFKKIGHAGTLDPMATGLLVLCTGRATKVIESIQSGSKRYDATVSFEGSTPSYDAETEIDQKMSFDHITEEMLNNSLKEHFTGSFAQKAPAFSALKHKGKPLYKLAREGKETPIKERLVEVYENVLTHLSLPHADLSIHCGKGTYIRSIAHDLAIACESRGHLIQLRRTEVSPFQINQAYSIEAFKERFCSDSVNLL